MRDGMRQSKPHKMLNLPRFSHFSGINIPPIATGLWLISRVLEKLILIIWGGAVFSIASMRGEF